MLSDMPLRDLYSNNNNNKKKKLRSILELDWSK